MEPVTTFYILVVIGIFASSSSQLLLKKSACREHSSFADSMFNWRVLTAYAIFFSSLFINITAMSHGVNLKDFPILESLGYIFVPFLSSILLKENITRKTIGAIALIILGIYIFYL